MKPWPRAPSRFSSGTGQSTNESARVSDAFQPSLWIGAEISYPGVPFGTTMFEISSSSGQRGDRDAPGAWVPALVMNIFAPLTTQLPSRELGGRARRAGVRAGVGLGQPERGELLPLARSGSQRSLLLVGAEQVDRHRPERVWAASVIATDESMRVSSSTAIAYDSVSAPAPPNPSGNGMPISPSSAISVTSSYGNRLSRSSSSATGRPARGERPHRVAHQLLLGREVEIHRAPIVAAGDRQLSRASHGVLTAGPV